MVDGQCVPVAAARGRQQHGHVDERILVHEIEQVLEETGVGAPEDGTGDQQQVSRLDVAQGLFDVGRQFCALQHVAEARRDLAELDQPDLRGQRVGEGFGQLLDQRERAGGTLQATGDGDDLECVSHGCVCSVGSGRRDQWVRASSSKLASREAVDSRPRPQPTARR